MHAQIKQSNSEQSNTFTKGSSNGINDGVRVSQTYLTPVTNDAWSAQFGHFYKTGTLDANPVES